MKGDRKNWHRLRVRYFRSVMKVTLIEIDEVTFVDYIGPRRNAY